MTNQCPQCGASLPAGALGGLCPACLLKQGAAAETATQGAAPFDPPGVAEVARLFPQLEILAFVGKGGMGAVYKARQPALDRIVALKILPPQTAADTGFAERFNREARALAKLNHPNIVAVHEFGQVNGQPFFLMEFVDGLNLRQLERAGKLSPREALQIVPQICEALQFAHDEGIVHRDIKPENILLDKKGRVKIADFGIAKIMGGDATDWSAGLRPGAAGSTGGNASALTEAGRTIGTPNYMAPEQADRPQAVDHRADIYSLGVVFYEMLTGELPLGKFAPPSRRVLVDVRLDEVVLRALEKEPEHRYQHASEFKTQVETIAGGAPSDTPVVASAPRFSRTAIDGALCALLIPISVPFLTIIYDKSPWRDSTTLILTFLGLILMLAATGLGWLAVAQIRCSAGMLYGSGLAVVVGLLFPLLLLDHTLVHASRTSRIGDFPGLLVALTLDALIVWGVWRKVNERPEGAPAVSPRQPSHPGGSAGSAGGSSALAYAALFFAGLSGVLGIAALCQFPRPPEILVWSILASALAGVGLAIPARNSRLGHRALIGGCINAMIWLVIGMTFRFISGTPPAPLLAGLPAPGPGAVAEWRAEGNANDSLGTNNGTLLNGVGFTNGEVGQGFNFSGINQSVQIPYSPVLISSIYSVEAWIRPYSQVTDFATGFQNLIFAQGFGNAQLVVRTGTTGVLVAFGYGYGPDVYSVVVSSNEIPIGQFSHVAGTWDGSALRIYINGVLNNQLTTGTTPIDTGCDFFIGGFYNPAAGDRTYVGQFFKGVIDEVVIYNRALPAEEVSSRYRAGASAHDRQPVPVPVEPKAIVTTADAARAIDASSALAQLREFARAFGAAQKAIDERDKSATNELRQARAAVLAYNEKVANTDLVLPQPILTGLETALAGAVGANWSQADGSLQQIDGDPKLTGGLLERRIRLLAMMPDDPAASRELLAVRLQQALQSSRPVQFGKYTVNSVTLSEDRQKALVRFLSSPTTYWDATLTRDEFGRWQGSVPAVGTAGVYEINVLVPDPSPAALSSQPVNTLRETRPTLMNAEVLRVKLAAAEEKLKQVQTLVQNKIVPESEADQAKFERDTLAAELKGDAGEVERLKFQFADLKFKNVEKLKAAGVIASGEYAKAKLARDLAAAELHQLQPTNK